MIKSGNNDLSKFTSWKVLETVLSHLKFDFKFTEPLYLSNVSRNGVVSSSAVYSEAPLILSSFCKGRAQQITASVVTAMEKVRVPKL